MTTNEIMNLVDAYAETRIELHTKQRMSLKSQRTLDACELVDNARAAVLAAVTDLVAENERLKSSMNPDWDVKSACMEAVREMQIEYAALRATNDKLNEMYNSLAKDYADLTAKLAALESREPVGYVSWGDINTIVWIANDNGVGKGDPLYTAAKGEE